MARTIQQIKSQILTEKANQPDLSGLTSTSQVSIFNLWAYITAVAIFVQEQLWDLFRTETDNVIAVAPVGTDYWVQSQTLKFQYDALNPQIVQLNNFVPAYPTLSPNLQIITRASVLTLPNNFVSVKVAKSNPPEKLTTPELDALSSYLDTISFAGVQYLTKSFDADELLVGATIYYNGQYSSIIQQNVINAVNDYLLNVPFDGYIILSKIEDALQNVQGVNDVVLNNVALRANTTPFASKTYLLENNTEIYRRYPLYAGYAITETTTGSTILDTITYIAE
jgi:hypothetical protein